MCHSRELSFTPKVGNEKVDVVAQAGRARVYVILGNIIGIEPLGSILGGWADKVVQSDPLDLGATRIATKDTGGVGIGDGGNRAMFPIIVTRIIVVPVKTGGTLVWKLVAVGTIVMEHNDALQEVEEEGGMRNTST